MAGDNDGLLPIIGTMLMFNGLKTPASIAIPPGAYKIVLRENQVKATGLAKLEQGAAPLEIPASSALILAQ